MTNEVRFSFAFAYKSNKKQCFTKLTREEFKRFCKTTAKIERVKFKEWLELPPEQNGLKIEIKNSETKIMLQRLLPDADSYGHIRINLK